jgi:hypothetical protein
MYSVHPSLSTPPDNTKVCRYLDLSHFLSLLSRRTLYFANVTEFDDRWEGALHAGTIEALRRDYRHFIRNYGASVGVDTTKEELEPETLQKFKTDLRSDQAIYGINCWHQNEVESVGMWKLYTHGKDGVAIQTTVGRLKACLSHETRRIFIAQVHYVDHETLPAETLISYESLIPIVAKRRSFAHESEVRLIMDRRRETDHDVEELRSSVSGENIAVDISNLIEKIVASPDYPGWAMASLQERVAAAGLEVKVEKSDLLTLPEPIKIPYVGRGN